MTDDSLTGKEVQGFAAAFSADRTARIVQNAVAETPIDKVAMDREIVTSIDPSGRKAGDTVLITGTNFIGVTGVTCTVAGKTAPVASYRVLSQAAISAVLPVGVQTGNFIVTNAVGASAGKSYTVGA